jgi:CRP/FNR family cyclic AMP-dependent transcriptional regulator
MAPPDFEGQASMRKVLFLFGQLTDEDVEWVGRVGQRLRVPAGEVLVHEGRHVPLLYILLAGRAEVAVSGVGKVAAIEVGDVFGEMSFVDAMPPSATVRAEVPSIVLAVPKAELGRHIAEDPTFGCRFYRALAIFLSDRLRAATRYRRSQSGDSERLSLDGDGALDGELDGNVLDAVSQAGARFDRLMRTLLGADAR